MYLIDLKKDFDMALKTFSYAKRYSSLINYNKKKKIVYIKNQFDNSTFRYRCHNFIQALDNTNNYEIIYFSTSEIPSILEYLDAITMIVFQRTTWTIEVENLIYLAKNKNIITVYDMDDLLFQLDHVPNYINHIGFEFSELNLDMFFATAAGYDMVAKKCDAYLTTTEHLKIQLEKTYNKPAFVIPNFLNFEQIKESKNAIKIRKYNKDKFLIGYFSGSDSHRNDLRVAENDLIRLLDKYDDIYIYIVGFMNFTGKLKEYQNIGRIIFKELVSYEQLQYEIAQVDLNIIPLVDNDFNQSKSELKFFEAGILKVPSCITPTSLYKKIIVENKNGVLCTQGNWFENIEKLYLNKSLLKKIGEEAYKTTCEIYFPKNQTKNIEKVYDSILSLKNNDIKTYYNL